MSQDNREVFVRCIALSEELVLAKKHRDAWAVLSALQAYLDPLPAYADGSCRKIAEERLRDVSQTLRTQAPKREFG